MRLLTLYLERYGCFTDKLLTFRPGACLHIVYGVNEAGKSSSLSAIQDLLFGFGTRTDYAFLHPSNKLSVGASISAEDGRTLSFKRRKGNKATLTGSDGSPLVDNALVAFLGPLDRQVFSNAFGLSQKSLRQGAEEMLESGGEAGSSLFAAASGLRGLNLLRKRLDTEASNIFAVTKAQHRTFYQARDRFEEANQLIRTLELKERDLRGRQEKIEAASLALEAVRALQVTDVIRRERLQRQRDLAPLLRSIEADETELATWNMLPELSTADVLALRAALDASKAAEKSVEQAELLQTRSLLLFNSYTVDLPLLQAAPEIDALVERIGNVVSIKGQLSRVEGEAANYKQELQQSYLRLGLAADGGNMLPLPSDQAKVRLQALIARGKSLDSRLTNLLEAIEREGEELTRLDAQMPASGFGDDPLPLRQALIRLEPILNRLSEAKRLERVRDAEERSITVKGRQLLPAVVDMNALAQLSLPSGALLETFQQQRSTRDTMVTTLEERVVDKQDLVADLGLAVERLIARPGDASPERIRVARDQRQAEWVPLREIVEGRTPVPTPTEAEMRLTAFEKSMLSADDISDRAVLDADRLAQHTEAERRLADEKIQLQSLERSLSQAHESVSEEEKRWQELWSEFGFVAQSPQTMLLWLSEIGALLSRQAALQQTILELLQLQNEFAAVRPALHDLALRVSLSELLELPLELTWAAVEAEISARETQWRATSTLLTLRTSTSERLRHLSESRTKLETEKAEWESAWRAELPMVHLHPSTTHSEAEDALEIWGGIPTIQREYDNRSRRVRRMHEDLDSFTTDVTALLATLRRSGSGGEFQLKQLAIEVKEARNVQSKASLAREQLETAKIESQFARHNAEQQRTRLQQLARVLPAQENVEVDVCAAEAREAVLDRLRERRSTLKPLSRGEAEASLRSSLADFNEDAAVAEIGEISQRELKQSDDENRHYADGLREREELEALQAGVGAEVALQQRKNAEAELIAASEAWAVKRFGQILLEHAVEEHRKQQEQPLMRRAGQLFLELTGGSFRGIEQEYDDDDSIRLVGRRDADKTVCVPAMSEGTRDQLYLALRLAYLEEYAERTGPVPFISDDLLTSFDEQRTSNGLRTLAATGSHIQPILFTHHRHVVDLALEALGASVDVIELGV